ncbi:MAG: putative RNA-binding protein (virulence factor B family) [Oceanicoccus sp.]|jgi:predicted RNA-binding protein (virulence factor B family)
MKSDPMSQQISPKLSLGCYNTLAVVAVDIAGAKLAAADDDELQMPRKSMVGECKIGDVIEVFVYNQDEDWLATQQKPAAVVGEFARLKVAEVNQVGAFLDWGLPKELLLPFSEQKFVPEEGRWVLVYIYVDNSNRIAASTRIERFVKEFNDDFKAGQKVTLLITDSTELGFKAIVDNSHWGVLYKDEVFNPLSKGQTITGYIKRIRPDNKIDLSLQVIGYGKVAVAEEAILNALCENNGFMLVTDKTSPETIRTIFKVSKKAYKQAVGALYKQRRISLEKNGIRLVDDDKSL